MAERISNRMRNWNLDKKMSWFLTALVCVLSVVIFCTIASSYFVMMVKQSRRMAEKQLSSMAAAYESTLESYKSIAMALMMDDTVQDYLNSDKRDEAYYRKMNFAQGTLMNVVNMNPSMNFIAVVSQKSGDYLYKGNATRLNTKFWNSYEEDYENSGYGASKGTLRISYHDTYQTEEKKTLTIYQPVYSLTYINKEIGLFCMNYDDPFIDHLSMADYMDFDSDLFMIDKEGAILSDDGRQQEEKTVPWMDLIQGTSGSFTRENMLYTYQKIGKWNYYFINSVSLWDFYGSVGRVIPFLLAVVLIMIAGSVCVGRKLIGKIYQPVDSMVKSMEHIAGGRLDVRLTEDAVGNDFKKLAAGFNYMMDEINHLIKNVMEEQRQKEQIRFLALQSQIHPHFLYNTLECIHWQAAAEHNQKISVMVKALAKYYRICLSGGRDIICLEEELEHVESYLIIQNMRYDGIVQCETEVEEGLSSVKIPKLTLQPLVENSIYHGLKNMDKKKGMIWIRAVKTGEDVIISVSDNGIGMSEEQIAQMNGFMSDFQENSGYGIKNVNRRIELLFGRSYGLRYYRNGESGVIAEIRLPASWEGEDDV